LTRVEKPDFITRLNNLIEIEVESDLAMERNLREKEERNSREKNAMEQKLVVFRSPKKKAAD
jgi:hypothetical protein